MTAHVFEGLCPDATQPDALDPACPACQQAAAGKHADVLAAALEDLYVAEGSDDCMQWSRARAAARAALESYRKARGG